MKATEWRNQLHEAILNSRCTEQEKIEITNLIHEYEDQLCREQKRIDKIAVDNESGYDGNTVNLKSALDAIDNAPMPEI